MNKPVENIIELFTEVRKSTMKRLRALPEGKENWRVAEDKMSIADIVHHLIELDRWTIEKLSNEKLKAIDGVVDAVQINSRDDYNKLLNELDGMLNEKILAIKNLTYWDLEKKISDDRFDNDVSVWFVIMRGNVDHEIHHRGELAAYLQCIEKGY